MKCPEHGANYQTVKTICEQFGVILKDVEALRCPVDGEELFTMKQVEAISQTLEAVLDKRTIRRTLST